ncbi:MAG: dTDP-glucose 4,6-dehydratase [Burkholderiales bacterium]
MILVTGGAGFVGANFVIDWLEHVGEPVVNLDALTYAGNLESLAPIRADRRHHFVRGDINDRQLVRRLLAEHRPRAIIHLAAESHVDRSIVGPEEFVRTNVVGTFSLLEEVRAYWIELSPIARSAFRFIHISTDEVFGSLSVGDHPFTESSRYAPNSPYSASKAGADHLVRAYHHTYGLPTITTNCSNNYGPFQFPEKLIPLMIFNARRERPLPVYGDGKNIRDWLYVHDHCSAIRRVLEAGRPGETYNVGGNAERTNIEVVRAICGALNDYCPRKAGSYELLVSFVPDRAGHDRRYAIDTSKISSELGWRPRENFESGLRATVAWYLEHEDWVEQLSSRQGPTRDLFKNDGQ